jgi:hypothetical protein
MTCTRQKLKGNYRFGAYRWDVTKTQCVRTGPRRFGDPKPGTTWAFRMTGPNLKEPYDPHPFTSRQKAESFAKRFAQGEVAEAAWRKKRTK